MLRVLEFLDLEILQDLCTMCQVLSDILSDIGFKKKLINFFFWGGEGHKIFKWKNSPPLQHIRCFPLRVIRELYVYNMWNLMNQVCTGTSNQWNLFPFFSQQKSSLNWRSTYERFTSTAFGVEQNMMVRSLFFLAKHDLFCHFTNTECRCSG